MHMQHAARTRPLVQVVDVLRYHQQLAVPFRIEPGDRLMRGIGLLGLDRLAPLVVEAQHEIGIAHEGLGRGDILDPVLFPQAAAIAEGIDPAFGGDTCPGEDHDVAHIGHLPSSSDAVGHVKDRP